MKQRIQKLIMALAFLLVAFSPGAIAPPIIGMNPGDVVLVDANNCAEFSHIVNSADVLVIRCIGK